MYEVLELFLFLGMLLVWAGQVSMDSGSQY